MEIKFYLYHKISPLGLNYLGITNQDPFKYKGSGKYWMRHLKAHKICNEDIKTIILFETFNETELIEKSIYYSKIYDIVESEKWANLIPETGNNSVFGMKHSIESKRKMSESRKGIFLGDKNPMFGKTVSDETREKIRISNTGKKHTDKTKEKIRNSKLGEKNHFYGKKHTDETKKKLSEHSSKRIGKLANMYGKKHTDESKRKMSYHRKDRKNPNYNPTPIIQYDINNIPIREWKDLIELRTIFSKRQIREISRACRGIIKTYNSYIWKFKK